jgi:hypothetical protein
LIWPPQLFLMDVAKILFDAVELGANGGPVGVEFGAGDLAFFLNVLAGFEGADAALVVAQCGADARIDRAGGGAHGEDDTHGFAAPGIADYFWKGFIHFVFCHRECKKFNFATDENQMDTDKSI